MGATIWAQMKVTLNSLASSNSVLPPQVTKVCQAQALCP